MAGKIQCPNCGKTVPHRNFCESCSFALTDEGKIQQAPWITDDQIIAAKRIEQKQRDDELARKDQEARIALKKQEEQNRHTEEMKTREIEDKREQNRHIERKRLIFLFTLIFLVIIGVCVVIGLSIAKKYYDNLPYLRNSHYKIWKNPVSVKEYKYFLSETNYESKTSTLQNYVKHINDEKMELVSFVDFDSMEENSPVVYVSFRDAIEYCNFKSNDEGLKEYYTIHDNGKIVINAEANGYRLPTVEEWTDSAKKFKDLRDDGISEWCFDTYNNSEQFRILKKYQKGIKTPAEYQSYSDAAYGVDTIGFRVIKER